MSILDKVISAVTTSESEENRVEAHQNARSVASAGDWLWMILDHHEWIEQAFAEVRAAGDAVSRRKAQKNLRVILNGHSMAEEAVVYPALVRIGKHASAEMAYAQQVAAKLQLAALEHYDPMCQDYLDKLEHLEGAVSRHVYEEEHDWYVDLKQQAPPADQQMITQRYAEEFDRYIRGGEDPADDAESGPRPTHTETL
ncbi:MAG TPA: hemerythrin domain-containing protein [Caulobacteraceae bacterium]